MFASGNHNYFSVDVGVSGVVDQNLEINPNSNKTRISYINTLLGLDFNFNRRSSISLRTNIYGDYNCNNNLSIGDLHLAYQYKYIGRKFSLLSNSFLFFPTATSSDGVARFPLIVNQTHSLNSYGNVSVIEDLGISINSHGFFSISLYTTPLLVINNSIIGTLKNRIEGTFRYTQKANSTLGFAVESNYKNLNLADLQDNSSFMLYLNNFIEINKIVSTNINFSWGLDDNKTEYANTILKLSPDFGIGAFFKLNIPNKKKSKEEITDKNNNSTQLRLNPITHIDSTTQDNDNDGFVNSKDKCPNSSEIFNGINDDDGCPELEILKRVSNNTIFKGLSFSSGKTTLSSGAKSILNNYLWIFKDTNNIVIIKGYSDATGDYQKNIELSQKRANAVRDYFIKEMQIPSNRIISVGYGPNNPIADNRSLKGRKLNRRIEFEIKKAGNQIPTSDL